eukprot:scaffold9134_cov67-Phaeocystis_antarctica.AAC.1
MGADGAAKRQRVAAEGEVGEAAGEAATVTVRLAELSWANLADELCRLWRRQHQRQTRGDNQHPAGSNSTPVGLLPPLPPPAPGAAAAAAAAAAATATAATGAAEAGAPEFAVPPVYRNLALSPPAAFLAAAAKAGGDGGDGVDAGDMGAAAMDIATTADPEAPAGTPGPAAEVGEEPEAEAAEAADAVAAGGEAATAAAPAAPSRKRAAVAA